MPQEFRRTPLSRVFADRAQRHAPPPSRRPPSRKMPSRPRLTIRASGNQIIVTAQKVEQRLQDVPITISATSGERIRGPGRHRSRRIIQLYSRPVDPGTERPTTPGIVIRGITPRTAARPSRGRASRFIIMASTSRARAGRTRRSMIWNASKVNQGPAATLFGTASAVGAISLVSARPREGFSGEVRGGYGNFNQTLLGRPSQCRVGRFWPGASLSNGATATAMSKPQPVAGRRNFTRRTSSACAARSATPRPPISRWMLIATYDQQRNGGTPFISGTFPAFAGAPGGAANAFENANLSGFPAGAAVLGDDQLGLNREVYDFNITAEYQFADEWTFTTVNGYREFDSLEVFDADGSAAPFLEFTELAKGWQVSHEGRFT